MTEGSRPPETATILLVEDEDFNRDLVQEILVAGGYHVRAAGTMAEALTQAEVAPRPALLLTDMRLPDGSGLAVAQRLRAEQPTLRVLYMTGLSASQFPSLAPTQILEKPFPMNRLLAAVRDAMAESRPSGLESTAMADDMPLGRWLLIVKRDQRDLYDSLRTLFAGDPSVEIILDRRTVESPEETARWQERRAPLSSQQTAAWADLGFFLARRQEKPTEGGSASAPDRAEPA